MLGFKQLLRVFLSLTVVAVALVAFGQDAPENPAPAQGAPAPNNSAADDSELAAEVQRLRTDLDRLQQQVAYLSSLIEQMQSQRAPVQPPAAKPAAPQTSRNGKTSGSNKKKSATVADAGGPATPSIAPDVDDRVTKTLLVFKDGHKVEATNYAIVGQSLWIYTENDSKRVPLSDLDVTATKSANSDRGVTFQIPPSK
jgi:TolA-binding protein